jgi:hypothetical protein
VVGGVPFPRELAQLPGLRVGPPDGGELATAEQGEEGEAVAVVGLLAAEAEQPAALRVRHQDGGAGAVQAVREGVGAAGGFQHHGVTGSEGGGELRDAGLGVGEAAAEAFFAGEGVDGDDVQGTVVNVDGDILSHRQTS